MALVRPQRNHKLYGKLVKPTKIRGSFIVRRLLKPSDFLNYYFQETHKDLPESLFERMNGDSDSFYRHSMGQVITAIKSCRQKSPNLRYSLQIHSSLVSGITKRSFFNTLFATNQPKTGKIKMPSIGDALLDALRNDFEISIEIFCFF